MTIKNNMYYLVISVVVIIVVFGGWYIFQSRKCEKQITYIPPREAVDAGDGFYGALNSVDSGDYHLYQNKKYKTSDDAMRACIWQN